MMHFLLLVASFLFQLSWLAVMMCNIGNALLLYDK